MTQPTGQSYQLPEALRLHEAHLRADAREADAAVVARSICLLLAATVRDLLTDCDHDAAFDATGLELVLNRTTEVATATGFYWTSGGQYAEFTGTWDIFHLRNWSSGLTSHNRETWAQLCEVLGEDDEYARYRLDLTRAAAL